MNNREWLNSLSNEEFVAIAKLSCDCCIYNGCRLYDSTAECKEGRLEWLEQEHK